MTRCAVILRSVHRLTPPTPRLQVIKIQFASEFIYNKARCVSPAPLHLIRF